MSPEAVPEGRRRRGLGTCRQWWVAAGSAVMLAVALSLLLEPVNLPAGLHGPDGRNYLSLIHSLWSDRDLLLYNDNALFGQRIVVTPTGYALELHNIGTALAFLPFYAGGQWTCQLAGGLCAGDNLPTAVWLSLGNWLYGLLGLVVTWRLAARHAGSRWALLAVAGVALGSSFFYYWTRFFNPHMPALFLVALLALVWDGTRDGRALHHWLLLGILGGLAATIASYNLVILLLPAGDLAWGVLRRRRIPFREAVLLATGALIGFAPQLVAWKLLFGSYLGTPYARQLFWLQPGLPDLFVSAYHGLYFYAPLLLIATAGFVPLFRRDRRLAVGLLLTFAALAYVCSCNIAWWGGASFGARYLLVCLPLLTVPFAVLLERARWRVLLGALSLAGMAWTYGLMLADYGRLVDPGQYVPAAWQLRVQARVLGELPALLRLHLLAPRFEGSIAYALPASIALVGVAWLMARVRRLPGAVATGLLACLPLMVAVGLALSAGPSRREIARLEAEGSLASYPRGSYDVYDLSEGYWQRGAYRFVRGDLDGARSDFATARQIDPSRGWVHMHAAGQRYIPRPVVWKVDAILSLAGWEADADTVSLYWLVAADVLAPSYRTTLQLYGARGEVVAAYASDEPDAWRALAGDLVRATFSLPPGAVTACRSLSVAVYAWGAPQPLATLELPFGEP